MRGDDVDELVRRVRLHQDPHGLAKIEANNKDLLAKLDESRKDLVGAGGCLVAAMSAGPLMPSFFSSRLTRRSTWLRVASLGGDTTSEGYPLELPPGLLIRINSHRLVTARVEFYLRIPEGWSTPLVVSEVGLEQVERELVSQWLRANGVIGMPNFTVGPPLG